MAPSYYPRARINNNQDHLRHMTSLDHEILIRNIYDVTGFAVLNLKCSICTDIAGIT